MSDIIDQAQKQTERIEAMAINDIRSRKPVAEYTGECLFCGKPELESGRRWCNSECRDLWEKLKQ